MPGQHDQEEMPTDMVLGADMDRPYLETRQLAGPEGLFDPGQALAGLDRILPGHVPRWKAGPDHVDAVKPCLPGNLFLLARPGKVVIANGDVKMLFNLAPIGFPPDPFGNGNLSPQLRTGTVDLPGNLRQCFPGGPQQILAPACPFGTKPRIEADQKAFPRKGRVDRFGNGVGDKGRGIQDQWHSFKSSDTKHLKIGVNM